MAAELVLVMAAELLLLLLLFTLLITSLGSVNGGEADSASLVFFVTSAVDDKNRSGLADVCLLLLSFSDKLRHRSGMDPLRLMKVLLGPARDGIEAAMVNR